MTLIPEIHSLFVSATLLASFALVSLATLWQVRNLAVYLWVIGGLAGAIYSLATTGVLLGDPNNNLWLAGSLGFLIAGSATAKLVAIRLLAERSPALPRGGIAAALVAVLGGVGLLRGVSVGAFLSAMSLAVALLASEFARQAYKVGREQQITNATFLAVVIGLQAAVLGVAAAASLLAGDNPLPDPAHFVTLTSTIVVGALSAVNNGLFVALVLNIYVKRLQIARAEAVALESERSRLAERERLLAEMHDGLGSQLASAKIRFERGAITTQQAGEVLQECVTDLHLLVDTLRGTGDDLEAALSDLRYRLDKRVAGRGLHLTWAISLDRAPRLPSAVVLNVLRAVQEAITNALKHAGATEISVLASYSTVDGIQVRIADNGRGLPVERPQGRGLANMQRRVAEAGGAFKIDSREGGGTRVSISLPTRVV